MNVQIEESWKALLEDEFDKPYFSDLVEFVRGEYARRDISIYPPGRLIFNAFNHCSVENTKVVILGQDPYHGLGRMASLFLCRKVSIFRLHCRIFLKR